jgi:glucokinase
MSKFIVGVDVGGTNIKLGIINDAGRVIARSRLVTTHISANKNQLIEAVVTAVKKLISEQKIPIKQILGIGFGLPGLVNPDTGMVIFLPNIPGWRNVPLRKIVQSKLRLPVYLDNDVNVIALAEWKYGAGRGFRNLICITLGTGVGGGLILNNSLYRGEGNVAGEIGHMPLNETGPSCNCGGFGCFERYVGNRTLQAKAEKIFKIKGIQFPDMYKMFHEGRNVSQIKKFWQEAGEQIGNGLVGVVNLLNPQLIVIGGGVSNNFKFFAPTVNKVIQRRAMKVQAKMVKIVHAQLDDDAGIVGAQVLVKESQRGQ